MRKVQPQGPYLVAGFSVGGIIAFEIAQQLRRQGEEVALLALLDSLHPSVMRALHYRKQSERRGEGTFGAAERLGSALLGRHYVRLKTVARAGLYELAYTLKKGLKQPVPARLLMAVQAGMAARYRAKPFDGRIVLVRTEWSRWPGLIPEDLGWGGVAKGGVDILRVPGEHTGIIAKRDVRQLAEALSSFVEQAHELHRSELDAVAM
jgi:thioesterase domain-containing protein